MSKTNKFKYLFFAPAGTKILDLFDSEHPYLESRKSNIAYMSGGMGVSLFPSDPDQ